MHRLTLKNAPSALPKEALLRPIWPHLPRKTATSAMQNDCICHAKEPHLRTHRMFCTIQSMHTMPHNPCNALNIRAFTAARPKLAAKQRGPFAVRKTTVLSCRIFANTVQEYRLHYIRTQKTTTPYPIYEQYFASKFSTGKSPFLYRSASKGNIRSRTVVLPLYNAVR